MPVRFQKSSEYQQQYKWLDSVKSATFVPTQSQAQEPAGLPSEKLGKTVEPPLQHKKRPASTELGSKSWDQNGKEAGLQLQRKKKTPPSASSLTFYADEVQPQNKDEYMLLGNQSKFANNVVYRAKHRDDTSEGDAQVATPPPAPRENRPPPPPPPKVYVNVGGPKLPKKRADPPQDVPKPPMKIKQAPAVGVGRRYQNEAPPPPPPPKIHREKPSKNKEEMPPKVVGKAPVKEQSQKPPRDWRQRQGKKVDEVARTEPEKGVVSSGQEAGANYAMKYQAGVAPSRPSGPKRLSEYQMQYDWKKGVVSSPLIAAQQMIYNSNPQVAPYKSDSFVKDSEYKAQFKPWSVSASMPVSEIEADDTAAKNPKHKHQRHHRGHKSRIHRSRSLEDLSRDKRPRAGSYKDVAQSDKRLVKESMNVQKLHFPHGRFRKHKTEYEMNYKAPHSYEYTGGAWKGADPPHLQPQEAAETEQPAVTTGSSWFQEVRELREKAQEYKRRAQGTHFSRQHLAQLYAQQADLWDNVSTSSVLSALSLEVADHEEQREARKKRRKLRRSAWEEDGDLDLDVGSSASARGSIVGTPLSSAHSSRASCVSSYASTSTLVAEEDQEEFAAEGRIPTPKLKQGQQGHRHHLDRTTPAVGGALLTSPPRPQGHDESLSEESETGQRAPGLEVYESGHYQNVASKRSPEKMRPRRGSAASSHSSVRTPHQASPAAAVLDQSGTTPTFGMATRDSHVLVDEEASTDRPLQTQYVHSPPQHKTGALRLAREKFPEVDVPSTINEDGGTTLDARKTGTKKSAWVQVGLDDIPQRAKEDDVLSVSAASVASSCSLASEVLERARNRRDQFWGGSDGIA